MFPLDSILVVLQDAFLMSFFVAGTLTCLFSCAFRNSRIISPAMYKEVQGSLSDRTDSGKRAPSSISLVPHCFGLPLASPPRLQGRSGLPRSQFYTDSPWWGWSVIDVTVSLYLAFDEE